MCASKLGKRALYSSVERNWSLCSGIETDFTASFKIASEAAPESVSAFPLDSRRLWWCSHPAAIMRVKISRSRGFPAPSAKIGPDIGFPIRVPVPFEQGF